MKIKVKKKILIIGSQGYLGSRLVQYFQIKKKYDCEGIDIGYFENCKISKTTKIKEIKKNAVKIKENDLKKFDTVILLAAFQNDPVNNLNPKKFYKPSVEFTIKIANFCKKNNIRFIFPSSCSVYGYGNKVFTEKSKLKPLTHYSKNKVEIEKKLKKISDKNFKPIILRLATVFGFSPRIRFDLVINMFAGMALTKKSISLNSNGKAWRPHIHIDDVCKVFDYFINCKILKKKNMIFNIGDNRNNLQILNLIKIFKNNLKKLEIFFPNNLQNSFNLYKEKVISTDGVDKRSYRVCFKKLKYSYPELKLSYDLKKGISKTLFDLKKNNLTKKKFESYKFYRIEALKKVLKNLKT